MTNIFNYQLTTISPVHIGSQETLSSYGDYIYRERRLFFIDEKRLSNFFRQNENMDRLMDDYLEIIKLESSSNLQDRYNIGSFFEKNGLDFMDFISHSLDTNGDISQSIFKTANTSGRPYIPGSSLKGAIRTCLLYHHNKKEEVSEKDIFGQYDKDILKNLLVSDTNPVDLSELIVLRATRYNLKGQSEDVPLIFESIKKGVSFKFQIKIKKVEDKRLDYLNSNDPAKILSIINSFYKDAIEREIRALEKNFSREMKQILDFYYELKKKASLAETNKNSAIMRIGRGKTFFENTIGLALDEEELSKIISRLGSGQRKADPDFFPKTRTWIGYNGKFNEVLGWIELKIN